MVRTKFSMQLARGNLSHAIAQVLNRLEADGTFNHLRLLGVSRINVPATPGQLRPQLQTPRKSGVHLSRAECPGAPVKRTKRKRLESSSYAKKLVFKSKK